jgi:apolipoprotein D and lipocalin family protein
MLQVGRLGLTGLCLLLAACAARSPEMQTVDYVDLDRFMGDWYVIANIPTFIEKDAYNAVENYELAADGRIETTFSFRKGGFDGAKKTYTPTGFVRNQETNAEWGMQFIWPVKADYRVVYLDRAYTQTIIGRNKRDYVWIMARTPTIPDADYAELLERVAGLGYDVADVKRVPQQW